MVPRNEAGRATSPYLFPPVMRALSKGAAQRRGTSPVSYASPPDMCWSALRIVAGQETVEMPQEGWSPSAR